MKATFIAADGSKATIDIDDGVSLMEGAVRGGIEGIDADCGGALSCATCQVHIVEEWLALVPPASQAELDMLEFAIDVDATSRLSCQIIADAALDGLTLRIPERQS